MSEKRKDAQGRILRNGEVQLADGRYRFKYIDADGKEKYVYSWRLRETDLMPDIKRKDLSLREKEKQIERAQFEGLVPNGGDLTVLKLVEQYISTKVGVRQSTRTGYQTVINILKQDAFGSLRIDKVKTVDAKEWLIKLQEEGRGYSSIHSIRGVLRPAFETAYQDDLIRKNPFQFELATVVVNDSVTRDAITRNQEKALLRFIEEDKHFCRYYDVIYILLNTGLRISEFCGLRIKDIEFKEKRINVDHQLLRHSDMRYEVLEPKTESGKRYVPMTKEVAECFKRIIAKRKKVAKEPVVDGYSGFLCLDKNGMPMVALHWEKYMQHIREKYNKIYREELPCITPHVCRHTYCSKMAKSGMNPKTLQYIMGHSDISVTLNTYTHLKYEDVEAEADRVTNNRDDNPFDVSGWIGDFKPKKR